MSPPSVEPMRPEDLKSLAEQVMTPKQVKEFADNKEADFAIGVPGIGRFRVNILRQRSSFMIVMRVIPFEVPSIDKLGLPKVLEKVAEADDALKVRHELRELVECRLLGRSALLDGSDHQPGGIAGSEPR